MSIILLLNKYNHYSKKKQAFNKKACLKILKKRYFYPLFIFSFNATKASKSPNVDFSAF